MENESVESVESSTENSTQSSEVSEGITEVSSSSSDSSVSDSSVVVSGAESSDIVESKNLDEEDERSEKSEDLNFEDSENEEVVEDEKPESTVVQVIENPESETGYDVTELDVESLNLMSGSYVDQMLAVTPTTNDYYTFIDDNIMHYFSGIMANYPLNKYKAYHLRHWVYQSQYSSYYDDYYYLFYDTPDNDCVEIYKPYNSNSYQVTWGNAEILNSTITYGSELGMSDLREGVSYVSWLSALCVLGSICVLYIVHAIFKHLRR